jgi:hypothetical protein
LPGQPVKMSFDEELNSTAARVFKLQHYPLM